MDKPMIHRRVNVKTTTKGVQYAEATFTMEGEDVDEIDYRQQALAFFGWVDQCWPPPVET